MHAGNHHLTLIGTVVRVWISSVVSQFRLIDAGFPGTISIDGLFDPSQGNKSSFRQVLRVARVNYDRYATNSGLDDLGGDFSRTENPFTQRFQNLDLSKRTGIDPFLRGPRVGRGADVGN